MHKSIKICLIILSLFLVNASLLMATGTTPYINLKNWDPGCTSTEAKLGFIVRNYSASDMNINTIQIDVYFKKESGAVLSDYLWVSYGGNLEIRNSSDGYVSTNSGFLASFSDVTSQDCGILDGVDREVDAKIRLYTTESANIPAGGYLWASSDTNAFGQFHRTPSYLTLDYSKYFSCPDDGTDTRLSTLRSGAIDNKYFVVYVATVQACESTDSSGTEDTASGIQPCSTSACAGGGDTPTFTETVTPSITQTVTQTVTQTITQTITETHTVTETITPTPTFSVTKTITPTFTITQTHTVTPTRTPVAVTTPASVVTAVAVRTPVAVRSAVAVKTPSY